MDITKLISSEVIIDIKNEINLSNGNEIFFKGIIDKKGMVIDVEVLARGNRSSVSAILKKMKKNEAIIHNHPSGLLTPSDNDIQISSIYCNNYGGASYIINNDATEIYVIVPYKEEKFEKISIENYFKKNGNIESKFTNYEYRKEQQDMAISIEDGLNTGKKVIIEAGTGTGKTLAYLIPLVEFSLLNNIRGIVSTNTINLQEQLLSKDLPLVSKIINKNFKYSLVKGRSNFLCIRKAKNIKLNEFNELNDVQKKELTEVLNWASQTNYGDRNELFFEVNYEVWDMVNSESDFCLKTKCPYKDRCYFNISRKNLLSSDILIVNHHMFFSDLDIRKELGFYTNYSILPDYNSIVFDEAHNIESVARDYFSFKVSKYAFNKTMNKIYNVKGTKKGIGGSIIKVLSFLNDEVNNSEFIKSIHFYFDNYFQIAHKNLLEKGNDFFNDFINYFSNKISSGETKIRLTNENILNNTEWENIILNKFDNLKSEYIRYQKIIKEFSDIIDELNIDDDNGIISDFFTYVEKLSVFFKNFDFILKREDGEYVYWVEISIKVSNIIISATPLSISENLNKNLYEKISNIIFTSATLAINNKFDYFKNTVGINEKIIDKVIDSPFNYKEQMKVIVPTDISLPNDKNFIMSIKDFIVDMLIKTNGNTFILFTSYNAMNSLYKLIENRLYDLGFDILLQGKMPRNKLLETYKLSPKPVLFGTDSFWEGVDVQGEKLKSVIIVKIPFKVPTEPVIEAIIENITNNGGNSFMEYQVPEAVIKFKQGIGRLIRSKKDSGYLTILDTRVLNKTYGKTFYKILEKGDIIVDKKDRIIEKI